MAVLQLLRNKIMYDTREKALEGIQKKGATLADGEMCIVTYGVNGSAKSIVAVKRDTGLTIFDNEETSLAIANIIDSLDSTVGSKTVDTGKHIAVEIVEKDGKLTGLTVTENNIANADLLGAINDPYGHNTAFGQINTEKTDRINQIKAIKYVDSTQQKKFVTSVSQTDGKITTTKGSVTSNNNSIIINNSVDGGVDLSLNLDNKTLQKNSEGKIAVVNSELLQYTGDTTYHTTSVNMNHTLQTKEVLVNRSSKTGNLLTYGTDGLEVIVNLKKIAPSNETIKEEYQLIDGNNNKIGTETIKIYKDSSIYKIYLGKKEDTVNQVTGETYMNGGEPSLNYVYLKPNGVYDIVKIPISSFATNYQFRDGFETNGAEIRLKIVENQKNQGLLVVSSQGLEINPQKIFDVTKYNLSKTTTYTQDPRQLVTIGIYQIDGIVSLSGLNVKYGDYTTNTDGISTVFTTKAYVDNTINNISFTCETDGKINVSYNNSLKKFTFNIPTEAPQVKKPNGISYLAGTNKLTTSVEVATSVNKVLDAYYTERIVPMTGTYDSQGGRNMQFRIVQQNGIIKSFTNIKDTTASLQELNNEIAIRKSVTGMPADSYNPRNSGPQGLLTNATSFFDADAKLEDAILALRNTSVTSVVPIALSGGIIVEKLIGNSVSYGIALKMDPQDNALTLGNDGLKLSNIWDCGEY